MAVGIFYTLLLSDNIFLTHLKSFSHSKGELCAWGLEIVWKFLLRLNSNRVNHFTNEGVRRVHAAIVTTFKTELNNNSAAAFISSLDIARWRRNFAGDEKSERGKRNLVRKKKENRRRFFDRVIKLKKGRKEFVMLIFLCWHWKCGTKFTLRQWFMWIWMRCQALLLVAVH